MGFIQRLFGGDEKNSKKAPIAFLEPSSEPALRAIAESALPLFGFDKACDLELLGHRENAVYKVSTPTCERFALRVHRDGYHTQQALSSELQWMEALDAAGVACPCVRPTTSGALVANVADPRVEHPRLVDVLGWVDGGPPGEENLLETYRTLGEINAKIHNQAEQWDRPPEFERHAWDEDGLLGSDPLWGRFEDLARLTDEQRDLLCRARDKARAAVIAFGKSDENFGLIHADLLPENIMVAGDGSVRVIDFDDAGFGWHMYDLATAVMFHCGEDHFDALIGAWVAGYRSQRALSDKQLAMLPTFILCRVLIALGWAHTRRETDMAKALTDDVIALGCHLSAEYLNLD